jgi:hypothetical protein
MENMPRDFKGIWIPKEIWLTDKLSLMEKMIFVEIHSLDNERGCFASNQHFSNFFGISPRQVSTHISSLKAKGYVSVHIENRNERTIRALGKWKRIPQSQIMKMSGDLNALVDKMTLRKSYPQERKFERKR